jgi:hypothetical protein
MTDDGLSLEQVEAEATRAAVRDARARREMREAVTRLLALPRGVRVMKVIEVESSDKGPGMGAYVAQIQDSRDACPAEWIVVYRGHRGTVRYRYRYAALLYLIAMAAAGGDDTRAEQDTIYAARLIDVPLYDYD